MVKLISSSHEIKSLRATLKGAVGFVPTMGNLHAGHISLLNRALGENEVVVFSIFVNPKQFGPNEDFHKYPRTLKDDLLQIETASKKFPQKTVIVFAPDKVEDVFPSEDNQTIEVSNFNNILEGKIRPGHFDGVATVVYKLFDIVKPTIAYFGLKDYQQYLVISQMVRDLQLPIKIVGMPIIREASGLALSSRNQYLSSDEKKEALILSQALKKIERVLAGKKENLKLASEEIGLFLADKRWNYLEMRDAYTLSQDLGQSKTVTVLGVYQIGTTRLLDNMQMEIE